ncbi:MAG: UrcA family protein [Allosphingosinicella sp.]
MNPIRSIALALVAGATLAAAAPAAATPASVPVSYAGLDLTSPAGIAELDARLDRAVREVCGREYPMRLTFEPEIRICRQQTLASVRTQRNTALAEARSRGTEMASR